MIHIRYIRIYCILEYTLGEVFATLYIVAEWIKILAVCIKQLCDEFSVSSCYQYKPDERFSPPVYFFIILHFGVKWHSTFISWKFGEMRYATFYGNFISYLMFVHVNGINLHFACAFRSPVNIFLNRYSDYYFKWKWC